MQYVDLVSASDRPQRRFIRFIPTLAGLAVLAFFAGLWLGGAHETYRALLTLWGMVPFQYPFFDAEGTLAALDCTRQGMDVIVQDPCDLLGRGYIYSPLWLSLDWLPIGKAWAVWIGIAMALGFLAAAAALPAPKSIAEAVLRAAATISTMSLFAVERGNPDVIIFMMAVTAARLIGGRSALRPIGYGVAFLAGAIKYYPFILLSLVARERSRIALPMVAAMLGGLVLFYEIYAARIAEGLVFIPSGMAFADMFGAINIIDGTFQTVRQYWEAPEGAARQMAALMLLLLFILLWTVARIWRGSNLGAALCRIDELGRVALIVGALLLTGCFFTVQSIGYRGVFLLMLQPALAALGRDREAGPAAFAARVATIGIPFLMWSEAIRLWLHLAVAGQYPPQAFAGLRVLDQPLDLAAWTLRELSWWLLIAFLLLLLAVFFLNALADRLRELSTWRLLRPANRPHAGG